MDRTSSLEREAEPDVSALRGLYRSWNAQKFLLFDREADLTSRRGGVVRLLEWTETSSLEREAEPDISALRGLYACAQGARTSLEEKQNHSSLESEKQNRLEAEPRLGCARRRLRRRREFAQGEAEESLLRNSGGVTAEQRSW